MNLKHFVSELKRRNVFKVGAAYAIAGWLIIQVIATISPQFGFPTWIPPLITTIILSGFPFSLIIAWAFEVTPEGVKKTTQIEVTESITPKTGKKLNRLFITILSLAIVFLIVERLFFASSYAVDNTTEAGTASIAVLPFVNMSNDKDNEFFSDGLSEELLNVLAQVENMYVAGRTSSFKFKGHNENLTIIGKELNVDNILEGSVQKSLTTIKITAQLIKVSDGFHIWSQTYERELNAQNIFEIQEEISLSVLKELKIHLLPGQEGIMAVLPTENIEAYNAFLEGTQVIIDQELSNVESAIKNYQKAIELDPNFSDAYARLAIAYLIQSRVGNILVEDTKKFMRSNIDKAILLNGNSGRAYDALGRYYLLTNEKDMALQTFEKAIQLLPNDGDVLDGYHLALEWHDRIEEADVVQKKAYDLDPLNPAYATHYANHLSRKNPEAALEVYDKVIKMYPEYAEAYSRKGRILSHSPFGKIDEAFELAYTAYQLNPEQLGFIENLYDMALNLNMYELCEILEDKLERLFPENRVYLTSKITNQLFANNLNAAELLINANDEKLDPFFNYYLAAIINYKAGNYDKAKVLFEKFRPEVTDSIVSISSWDESFFATEYGVILNALNETALFEEYKTALFNYKEGLNEAELEPLELKNATLHYYILSDKKKAINLMEDMYFNDNHKANTPHYIELSFGMLSLRDYPGYRALKNIFYGDLNEMGYNAIQSLKKRGIWREEFEMDRVKISPKL